MQHYAGMTFFYLDMCVRIARGGKPRFNRIDFTPKRHQRAWLRFWRFLFFGIPEWELPDDQNGKTAGELETVAMSTVIMNITRTFQR